MSTVITGRCLCGFVTYSYSGGVGPTGYCHCKDCRKCSGSAFGISARFEANRFQLTHGSVKGHTKIGDSGVELTRHFCPECGSPVYTSSPGHPVHIYVEVGLLDDPTVVKPTHQSWVCSAVPWAAIDQSLPAFQKVRT
jgi:hypothetical protein